jgi:hypothetical protein
MVFLLTMSLCGESVFESFPQSGLEFIPQGHDDHSRIVVAPGFIRHADEAIGHGGEIFRSTEDVKNVVLVDRASESV